MCAVIITHNNAAHAKDLAKEIFASSLCSSPSYYRDVTIGFPLMSLYLHICKCHNFSKIFMNQSGLFLIFRLAIGFTSGYAPVLHQVETQHLECVYE